MSRPAETAGAGGSFSVLVAYIFGVQDPTVLVAIAAGIGLVPAAVTTIVANGGIRGLFRELWRGTSKPSPPSA